MMARSSSSSRSGTVADIQVFISRRESTCGECSEELGRHAWITLNRDKGALCLSCADLDHLVFLPPGDAALTRRARKNSKLSAVVLEWSRSRKHYERQGLLVESGALERAEEECLSDAEVRERRREREALRRDELDGAYVERFAQRVRELFPGCPAGRERIIAEHACSKYSGRVGRSQAAKELNEQAVRLAVVAHIRHFESSYDDLLARDWDRWDARERVSDKVDQVMTRWKARI
jgi:hypothetical protein